MKKEQTNNIDNALREGILSGKYAPGTRLTEMSLANDFNCSRGKVRQSLQKLTNLGLIDMTINKGASVKNISLHEAKQLYQVRKLLEVEAAINAAKNISKEGIDRLIQLLESHHLTINSQPNGEYYQSPDVDFHSFITRLSGNKYIIEFTTNLLYPQLTLYRRQHKNISGRGKSAYKEHIQIAQAIIEGDSELAGIFMQRHLQQSWQSLRSMGEILK